MSDQQELKTGQIFRHEKQNSRTNISASKPDKSKIKSNIFLETSYLPHMDRGVELTFAETGHVKVFMMVRSNAFIQLDGEAIPTFQLR